VENVPDAAKTERLKELWIERHSIYSELDYFRDNGIVLGKHSIFERQQFKKELSLLSGPELVKKYNAVRKSLRAVNKDLRDNKRPDLENDRKAIKKAREWQLEALNEYLNSLK